MEKPAGTAELSTWCAHNVRHSATGTVPSTLIYVLTKCSQLPWERGHGTESSDELSLGSNPTL